MLTASNKTKIAITTNTVTDKNNVIMPVFDFNSKTYFKYRKCDAGDSSFINRYAEGYNMVDYSSSDINMSVPGVDFPGENSWLSQSDMRTHLTTVFIYPGHYYSTHPKWFATKNGNTGTYSNGPSYVDWQLCFTAHGDTSEYNAMVNETATKIKNEYDRQFPTNRPTKILELTVADNDNRCNCSACKAMEAQYGSLAATLIKFVNDVNSKVHSSSAYDNLEIGTSAYLQYEKPPVGITSDVAVRIAPIRANYFHSIDDREYNEDAYQMFEGWSKVARLHSWLYETNFENYLLPFNSFESITKSIKYMSQKNVEYAYIEGQHNVADQRRTGFTDLKVYLDGKFMHNPDSDYNELLDRYFLNYFGEGHEKMRTFFDELVNRMNQFDTSYTPISAGINTKRIWNKDELEKWVSLCKEAIDLVSNPIIKENILAESIFPQFALCSLFGSSYSSNVIYAMRQSFKNDADSLGINMTKDSSSIANTIREKYYKPWGLVS